MNRLSLLALTMAIVIGAYVAYASRPWQSSRGSGATFGLVDDEQRPPRPGESAPDFILPRADGTAFQLSSASGQPVFLNFWATWCTFCIHEMPDMQRIADTFDGQVVVVGLNTGDSVKDGAAYAHRLGVSYEIVFDESLEVTTGYSVRAMPTSYFISGDGTIADVHFGILTYDDMFTKIESLLEQDGQL